HGSLEPQVATWGFSSVRNFFDFSQVGFSKASGLSSDSLQRGAPESTLRAIGSMSPPDYSLARLRPRRAALRFTRRTQLTNQPIQHRSHLDQTQHFFYSRARANRWNRARKEGRRRSKNASRYDGHRNQHPLPDRQ